jgi:hypothetical protein
MRLLIFRYISVITPPPPIQCSQEKNLTLQDLQYTFVSFVQHCLWEDRAIGRQ